jgi:hypothetical protein
MNVHDAEPTAAMKAKQAKSASWRKAILEV